MQPISPPPLKDIRTPSGWEYFSSMPHHPMFMVGALQALLAVTWWLLDLGGRYGGWYPAIAWATPAPWAHLFLMSFALFPPYMFGFLMTTYPRWMAGRPVARNHYLPAAGLLATGIIGSYLGLALGKPALILALLVYLAGWSLGLYALLRVYASAERPDVLHARITSGVMTIGLILLALLIWGIAQEDAFWVSVAREGSIWWFLFPVFFAVSHRLIPFFSSAVIPGYTIIRPDWTLWLVTCGALLHGSLAIAGYAQWLWLADLPMAAVALWLSYQWDMRKTFKIRILAMLHIGFAWTGIALGIFAVQSLALLLDAYSAMGRGPLHALLIGYFSSMLVAMSTRVTLGHSGKPLLADNQAWAIFIALQFAAISRVLADTPIAQGHGFLLYGLSALIWLTVFGIWAGKFIPILWRPDPGQG